MFMLNKISESESKSESESVNIPSLPMRVTVDCSMRFS